MAQTVLIVDDEKNIVNIIAFNLKKEGYEVLTAGDGEEAVAIADEKNPDLILLDIMMPKMDGYEACRKIREKHNMPIIMLTARAEELDKVLGLEMGADDYVTKPFGTRELIARVKANLRRSVIKGQDEQKSANVLDLKALPSIWTNSRPERETECWNLRSGSLSCSNSSRRTLRRCSRGRHCLKRYGDMNITET